MDVMLTYAREDMETLTSTDIMEFIEKHMNEVAPEFEKPMEYYLGNHAILDKERDGDAPNATPVCNHAKDIADTASSYFLGTPITYKLKGDNGNDEAFTTLLDAMRTATVDDDDQENALMLSICGKTFEYLYVAEDEAELREESIDPRTAFLVYDQNIEHDVLFGVYYYQKVNSIDETEDPDTYIMLMTDTEIRYYVVQADADGTVEPYRVEQHNLGQVPLIEYKNNKFAVGDFTQQIELIDAYNTMTADRINDKEQFIDAILVIYGALMGADADETEDAMERLQSQKLLELPQEGARAEYLTRQLDESGMEVLREALKEDIYTFSHVPNLTDENFAGNSSGVAMEYKLLGLEMLTKTKERWYRRALRKRLEIFLHFLNLKGTALEEKDIDVVFSRSLPKNVLELSQIVNNLADDVTLETRLGLLPFVEDPRDEAEALRTQKEENVELQQELFASTAKEQENTVPEETNEPIEEEIEDDEE